MTYFATCIGCNLKSDCEQLAAIKKKVAGLNLTSIKHRCRDRTPEFKPGDPVFVETYATLLGGRPCATLVRDDQRCAGF